jgi:hypothetical protein
MATFLAADLGKTQAHEHEAISHSSTASSPLPVGMRPGSGDYYESSFALY